MVRLLWSSFTVNLESRFTLEELYHTLWLISPVRNKAVFEDYRRRGELCFDYDKALKVWNRCFVTDIVMCLVISVFDGGYHIAVIHCRYTVIMENVVAICYHHKQLVPNGALSFKSIHHDDSSIHFLTCQIW